MLYLLDFILFTGLFQGNAINELGSCCKVYVKMPDVPIHGNLDLKPEGGKKLPIKVIASAVELSVPARGGSAIPLQCKG